MDSTTVTQPVVSEVRAAADLMASAAGSVASVWKLADCEVESGLSLLVRLQARVAAVQAVLLAEVESRDLRARTGAPSVERWLGDRLRLSRADAGARLRQSVALRRHPAVLAALAAGSVTVEQGEVLAAVLHQVEALPGLKGDETIAAAEFLVEQCTMLGPRELSRAGQAVIETLTRSPSVDDPVEEKAVQREYDVAERALQHAERNWLSVTRRPGGRVRIRADLGPVGAAAFLAWCRHADTPTPGNDGFADNRTRSERRGDALVDLLHHGTKPAQPPISRDDLEGHGGEEIEADESGLFEDPVGDGVGSAATATGERVRGQWPGVTLNVITSLTELRAGIPGTGQLDTGAPLSVAAVRQLACDAQVVPAVLAGASQILDLGRSCRHFNRAQRRAVAIRDRGCVAPGCDAPPSACHVHHSRWWIRGGPTDLANAALLCSFHHRMVHRQDWAITLALNGFPQLHPPPTIDPTGRPRQHHRFTVDQRLDIRPPATARDSITTRQRT